MTQININVNGFTPGHTYLGIEENLITPELTPS